MCSCYVLKKTSRASVFEAMHCTAHDLCDDSESRVRFHKRKEDLWNSEVWCSPFAPALWLWSCVSAFSPPRFTSKSIPSCVMQAHVRSCAGAFFEVPAFFVSFHLFVPSPTLTSPLHLPKRRAARRTTGVRGRLSPPAGARGSAPLPFQPFLPFLFLLLSLRCSLRQMGLRVRSARSGRTCANTDVPAQAEHRSATAGGRVSGRLHDRGECRPAPGIRPAPLLPSPARESSLLLQKRRAARRTTGDRGRLSPPAGARGGAPLSFLPFLPFLPFLFA